MESPLPTIRKLFTRVKLTIIATIAGLYFVIGGVWLMWDLLNYLYHNPIFQNNLPVSDWKFYSPFYLGYVTQSNWSWAFDYGAGMVLLVGIPLLLIAAYEVRVIEEKISG